MEQIEQLPSEVSDFQLVDWKTVAKLLGSKDVEHCRRIVTQAGVPLVHVSERRKLPRWGELKRFIRSREEKS
jgi:hypothetical protein